jgi:hypothetical protein
MKTTRAITFWILRHPSGQSSLFASFRPLRGFGLDRPCGAPPEGNYVMARESARTNNPNSTRIRARREA